MEKRFDLVVVGEINADLVLSGDVHPEFGQAEKLVSDAALTVGSSACICACGAARLGMRTALLSVRGDDPFGAFMDGALREGGVDASGVAVRAGVKTGLSVILNRITDRAILTYPGSIPLLAYEDLDLDVIRSARHLHLASFYLLDALRPRIPELFRFARAHGLSVSLDTNYDPRLDWQGGVHAALEQADVFLPNETELLAIGGGADIPAALQRLARPGMTIALKQGGAGAQAVAAGRSVTAPTLRVDVADTVGAGDSFDAGFLCGYLSGWDLERCLRFACACGALSTRSPGGTAAQATYAEALDAMESA